ncbi:MAG: (S)-benzoin forming benzil reductase [Bacteroidales bacterium]
MQYFIITGASKGLGEALAIALLEEGRHLLCIARNESERLKKLAAAHNTLLDFFSFDLSQTQHIPDLGEQLFEKINTQAASGLYLVNNAGVIQPVGRVEDCRPDDVDFHMRVNLLAPMLLSAEFIRKSQAMKIEKRIMNISSGAAKNPYYGWSNYCTAKAGLDMFGRCISAEQEGETDPVKTMAIAPGIIDTDMQTTIRGTDERAFIHRKKFVELKETGQLTPPDLAGKKLAKILLSDQFEDGAIKDIRDSY